jgi:hypothetical protein
MATPNHRTTAVLVLELDDRGVEVLRDLLEVNSPHLALASYRVTDPEGIEDVLAVTTGWTRNT